MPIRSLLISSPVTSRQDEGGGDSVGSQYPHPAFPRFHGKELFVNSQNNTTERSWHDAESTANPPGTRRPPLPRLSTVLVRPIHFQHRHLDADDGDQLAALSAHRLTGAARAERYLSRGPGPRARPDQRHLRRSLRSPLAAALDPGHSWACSPSAVGILDHFGHIQAWQIYAFTFVSAAVGAFDGPARQAMFPVAGAALRPAQRRRAQLAPVERRGAARPDARRRRDQSDGHRRRVLRQRR